MPWTVRAPLAAAIDVPPFFHSFFFINTFFYTVPFRTRFLFFPDLGVFLSCTVAESGSMSEGDGQREYAATVTDFGPRSMKRP